MNKKYKIFIFAILILLILNIIINCVLIKELRKEKPLLIKETSRVCYMPKDCFKTEEAYLNQFPNKTEPKYFPECLVYCYKKNG